MTTNQEIKLNMYLAVRNFLIPNEGLTKEVPNFAASYATLLSTIGQIQTISEMQKVDKKGLAIAKNKLKETLITMAADNSRKISAFAKFSNNSTLLNETKFSESDFVRMTDVALKDYLQIIYDKAQVNLGSLSEYGITPESQKVFVDTITAYNAVLSTPRTGIAEKSKATKKLAVLFDSADAAVKNMDFAVGIIKLTQPDFYNGYNTSRKLVDTSAGNLALKATAIDLLSGEPVKGVRFTFKPDGVKATGSSGNGEVTKKTAAKGSFYIKTMHPGTYNVVVSKPGYKDKVVTVSVADGERSELKVELEKA
jgi:hypothetical protein